ncbi:ABC transporter permease [Anaeromyxobacter terrae]|uniref:ABC transporter permease n=1 Tax=Anaeromyxobacter terrae TaxID=2925406 RepID=UPI001F56DFDD|nr:ABC transporter permease [Anaeromyxobacter sp. SG22]
MSAAALARKELRQLSRDPRTVFVLVALPALLVLLFGFVLTLDVRHVPLAVLDRDRTRASREVIAALTSGELFELVLALDSEADVVPALDAGRATLVLVLPRGFGRELAAGRTPTVQALVDGSNATQAQTAQAYAEAILSATGARLSAGTPEGAAPLPLSLRLRVLFNPELASERFLIPGLIAEILMLAATVATALSIARERETGTMEQLLVSPLRPLEVVAGKTLPYAGISLASGSLVLGTAHLAFGLEPRGSVPLVVAFMALYVLGAQGLGLLISSVVRSQQVAFQVSVYATMLPSLVLSGFIFPVRTMPWPVQAVSVVVPARYFVSALRGVVLRGSGARELWPEAAALAAFAAVTLGLAAARLRRRTL